MVEMTDDRYSSYRSDRAQWNKKIAAMKRRKKMARYRLFALMGLAVIVPVLVIILVVTHVVAGTKDKTDGAAEEKKGIVVPVADNKEDIDIAAEPTEEVLQEESKQTPYKGVEKEYSYTEAPNADFLGGDNMQSNKAILVNTDNGVIVGVRDHKARIVPASMTKVLTVLVAAENISNLSDKVHVSIEATDYAYKNDCSSVGFAKDEEVTVEDLFYGTILSSGGDAAAQLAMYVAGTQEAFVDMMNDKLAELGISGTTHFTNTVGVYDDNHYSTCYDMAVIMNAAMDNELCRKVLSAHKYTTSSTVEHPEGITISNWFLRRIEDKETGGEVIGAKTGYVVQSGNCGVSYFTDVDGTNYICVTADAHSAWRCIYDHVDIYLNHT